MKKGPVNNYLILLLVALLSTYIPNSSANTGASEKAITASAELQRALSIKPINKGIILTLLRSKKYKDLERLLKDIENKFEQEPVYESMLNKSYGIFHPDNGQLLRDLDAWVKNEGSYISYAARGEFFVNSGYAARGEKYIKYTPEDNLIRMSDFFGLAEKDLNLAIELQPSFIPAYIGLISIAKAYGNNGKTKQILQKAIANVPQSYYIRAHFMTSLFPRWGGSFQAMVDFAEESAERVDLNPRLWSFKGAPYAELGRTLLVDYREYQKAIEAFDKALSYGVRTRWLNWRAHSYYMLKQYSKAFEDYKLILKYDPNHGDAIKMIRVLTILTNKSY